jgi:hypothetical protein
MIFLVVYYHIFRLLYSLAKLKRFGIDVGGGLI